MQAVREAATARSIRLGVTGGIGSGKSTVAGMFAACGATLIDADAISRAATAPGGAAIESIRAAFGPEMITSDGALDRARMRSLAFTDTGARQRLERIVHPIVGQMIAAQAMHATQTGQRLIVFDIPLLVESPHWAAQLDAVLVVDCSEDTQIKRVRQRSGLDTNAIRSIMATQASRAQRRAGADIVICNEALTLDEMNTKVHQVAHWFGL